MVVMGGGGLRPSAWGIILKGNTSNACPRWRSGDPRVVTRSEFSTLILEMVGTTSSDVPPADDFGEFFQGGEPRQHCGFRDYLSILRNGDESGFPDSAPSEVLPTHLTVYKVGAASRRS